MQSLARRALVRAAALENVKQCSFWNSKFEHFTGTQIQDTSRNLSIGTEA